MKQRRTINENAPKITKKMSIAPAPTLASLAKLLAQLTKRVDGLEEENAQLRKDLSTFISGEPAVRKKALPKVRAVPIAIVGRSPSKVDFNVWIDSVSVSIAHLTCMGNKGLLDATRMCMGEHLDTTLSLGVPVIVEKQRLYVYRSESGWTSCSNDDLTYIISSITRKIQELFMDWQNDNADLRSRCSNVRALDISYMSNLFDARVSREIRQKNIHAYLLEKIQ